MNLYFWFFALYALWITPVTVHLQVRMEHGITYRVLLRTFGLPVLRKGKEKEKEVRFEPKKVLRQIHPADGSMIVELWKQGHLKRMIEQFTLHDAEVYVRFSFADAAKTAITYAAVCTALQCAAQIRPLRVRGRMEMDFRGEGSRLYVCCIAQARLGKLTAEALRLWAIVISHRRKQRKAEEEQHAAASH